MAVPFLDYTENPELSEIQKNPKNSNLISFWAFLLSIFIYISVFYVFSLSPTTLLCTTKFWFVISNTLILIIAADFGAFSSSSKQRDFFDESAKIINVRAKSGTTIPSSIETVHYVRAAEKTMPEYRGEEAREEPREKIINMVVKEEKFEKKKRQVGDEERKVLKKRRSEKTTKAEAEREEATALKRTSSERPAEEARSEEDEFSRMSDEELNRRVENSFGGVTGRLGSKPLAAAPPSEDKSDGLRSMFFTIILFLTFVSSLLSVVFRM